MDGDGEETLTDLEREILEEYVKLKENLDKVSFPDYLIFESPH